MTKITAFEKTNLKQLRAEIDAALAPIKEKFGLTQLNLGNVSFNEAEFTGKLIGKVDASDNPKVMEQNKQYSEMLGYSDNIVGKLFWANRRQFKVTKIEINRPKYPIIAEGVEDKKAYKFKAEKGLSFQADGITYDETKNLFAHIGI